jgi:hypothetical protein
MSGGLPLARPAFALTAAATFVFALVAAAPAARAVADTQAVVQITGSVDCGVGTVNAYVYGYPSGTPADDGTVTFHVGAAGTAQAQVGPDGVATVQLAPLSDQDTVWASYAGGSTPDGGSGQTPGFGPYDARIFDLGQNAPYVQLDPPAETDLVANHPLHLGAHIENFDNSDSSLYTLSISAGGQVLHTDYQPALDNSAELVRWPPAGDYSLAGSFETYYHVTYSCGDGDQPVDVAAGTWPAALSYRLSSDLTTNTYDVLVQPAAPLVGDESLEPPTGDVEVDYDGTQVATAPVQQSEGQPYQVEAVVQAPEPTSETAVTIHYDGDSHYGSGDLGPFDVAVTPSIVLRAKPTDPVAGQSVLLHGHVVAPPGEPAQQPLPTGSVQLTEDGVPGPVANLQPSGGYNFPVRLPAGNHDYTVSYSGDGTYEPQSSGTVSFTVAKAATSTVLAVTPPGSAVHKRVVVKVTRNAPAHGTATGPVELVVNGDAVASADLTGGRTVFSDVVVPHGSSVEAEYSGDDDDLASAGSWP